MEEADPQAAARLVVYLVSDRFCPITGKLISAAWIHGVASTNTLTTDSDNIIPCSRLCPLTGKRMGQWINNGGVAIIGCGLIGQKRKNMREAPI